MTNSDRRYWPDAGLTVMGLAAIIALAIAVSSYLSSDSEISAARGSYRRWRLRSSQPPCRFSKAVRMASSRFLSSYAFSILWEPRLRPFFLSVR